MLTESQVMLTDTQVMLTEPQVMLAEPQVMLTEPQLMLADPQVMLISGFTRLQLFLMLVFVSPSDCVDDCFSLTSELRLPRQHESRLFLFDRWQTPAVDICARGLPGQARFSEESLLMFLRVRPLIVGRFLSFRGNFPSCLLTNTRLETRKQSAFTSMCN